MTITCLEVKEKKQGERERLVSEAEAKYGSRANHPEDEEVLALSPEKLVKALKKGTWPVERVVIAYIRAACDAQRKTNCLTEVLFEQAVAEAKERDKFLAAGGTPQGDFWGLPSSFKDSYNILGVDSCIGCSPHCFKPTSEPEDEGGLVKLFRQAGGIPFCKTNIPQTMLAFESTNPVFGPATNPYTATRTPGGSSGGEGALITMNGTPLGWGSDIGGSLRIPAHYCGCCSLKPVAGRWPNTGTPKVVPGFAHITTVVGPMGRHVADLEFASKAMINLAQAIPPGRDGITLIPVPWREYELPEKLKIGYILETGAVRTSPPCARAVLETVEALKKAGHEVVEFGPFKPDSIKFFGALTSADGYDKLLANIGSDPKESCLQFNTLGPRIPSVVLNLATWLVNSVLGDKVMGALLGALNRKSAGELWTWNDRKISFEKEFNKLAWDKNAFDVIICPVQATPALEHGRTKFLSALANPTILFNIVDSTAGVLPITTVDPSRDALPEGFRDIPPGSDRSWMLEKRVYGDEDPAYDVDKMAGLPVGVQVVAPAWQEEKVLKIMGLVEKLVGFKGKSVF